MGITIFDCTLEHPILQPLKFTHNAEAEWQSG